MQTATNFQPKKSSSPKKRLTQNERDAEKISSGKWWPFDRASGRLLEKLHKQHIANNQEEALL